METREMSLSTPCPCCQNRMVPVALRCESCGTKVEGPLRTHEFMSLSEEDLQFLRIFIQFEGRIRDMEAPLGLSYPTIRNRISEFKERLFANLHSHNSEAPAPAPLEKKNSLKLLSDLDQGKISFEEALGALHQKKRKNP